mgnify:CR=1 FL=1
MVEKEILERYWGETKKNMLIILFIWAIVSYGAALIASSLNSIVIFGFPLGYYMGAQGSIVVFVLLNLYNSVYQNKLDIKYDLAEEE